MNYENPDILWWLTILPLMTIALFWQLQRRMKGLRLGLGPLYKQFSRVLPKRFYLLAILLDVVALGLLIFGLARPSWDFTLEERKRSGVDMMILLDVSKSMDASDVKPSRMARAKREITDLINLLRGDRVGLLVFAGVPFVQCPLTTDYSAARMFLDQLSTNTIPVPGTNIGDAIKLAVKSLDASQPSPDGDKVIIVISDGEDHDPNALEAAALAKTSGIQIFSIGVGSPEGAPIASKGGFLRDESGKMVISKLDDSFLSRLSEAGKDGGFFVRSATGGFHLERIYRQFIRSDNPVIDKVAEKVEKEKVWNERFGLFAFAAMCVFVVKSFYLDWRFKQIR